VGIGRTPTTVKLEVAGKQWVQDATLPATYWGNTLSDYAAAFYDPSTKIAYFSADGTGTQLSLRTAGTERLRIDASGNVGIGTTSPQVSLKVTSGSTGTVSIQTTGAAGAYPTTGAGLELVAGVAAATDAIYTYNRDTSAYRNLITDSLTLQLRTSGTERMRIDASYIVCSAPIVANGTITTSTTSWSATSGGAAYSFGNIGLYLIYGSNAAFTIFWRDLVLCNIYGGATVIASNGYTGGGALPTRTYSSSPYLSVALTGTAGTYTGTWLLLN
jgi:hypothetical protein